MARSIRYIRDTANGSSVAASSYWETIEAYDASNAMLSGSASYSTTGVVVSGGPVAASVLSDNNASGVELSVDGTTTTVGAVSITCDLGALTLVDHVRILRYPGVVFYDTKTEVSENGTDWIVLRDSAVSGTYTEAAFPGTDFNVPAAPAPTGPGAHIFFLNF